MPQVNLLRPHFAHVLQRTMNAFVAGLPSEARSRLPREVLRPLPDTGVLGQQTLAAIIALSRNGYANALRTAIARNIPAPPDSERYMANRRQWLEDLEFVH